MESKSKDRCDPRDERKRASWMFHASVSGFVSTNASYQTNFRRFEERERAFQRLDGKGIVRWTDWFKEPFQQVYAIMSLLCIWKGIEISSRFDRGGSFEGMLRFSGVRKGWMLGRMQDLSDTQWRSFRAGIPILSSFFFLFCALSRSLRHPRCKTHSISILCVASVSFLFMIHGPRALFLLAMVSWHYFLCKWGAGHRWGPLAIWSFSCASLLAAKTLDGFSFRPIGMQGLDHFYESSRWHISYNLMVLRMISFGMDLHWFRSKMPMPLTKASRDHDDTRRTETGAFSFDLFLLYSAYPPLYLTGPIISYGEFAVQYTKWKKGGDGTWRSIAWYAIRLGFAFLLLELMTHVFYFNAIAKSGAWKKQYADFGPSEIGITGFWTLFFMWMKFLCIWRFARFWALMDGVDTVENMKHCLVKSYDIESFWKNWHASYNRWLVRYMYIPLGGRRWRVFNVWIIFTFVALWHDLEFRMLGWAWLISFFVAPEVLAKRWTQQTSSRIYLDSWWYPILQGSCCSLYVMVLMCANLAGFVLGMDGLLDFLRRLASSDAYPFLACTFVTLYVASYFARRAEDPVVDKRDRCH